MTRRKRCFPTFHSTSNISRPTDRATRSAASRIFSKSNRRLPEQCRCPVHSNRPNKKVGLRPPIRATRFRAKRQYIPPSSQKQDTTRLRLFYASGLSLHVPQGRCTAVCGRTWNTADVRFLPLICRQNAARSPLLPPKVGRKRRSKPLFDHSAKLAQTGRAPDSEVRCSRKCRL